MNYLIGGLALTMSIVTILMAGRVGQWFLNIPVASAVLIARSLLLSPAYGRRP